MIRSSREGEGGGQTGLTSTQPCTISTNYINFKFLFTQIENARIKKVFVGIFSFCTYAQLLIFHTYCKIPFYGLLFRMCNVYILSAMHRSASLVNRLKRKFAFHYST
jgi:hypothetical protein